MYNQEEQPRSSGKFMKVVSAVLIVLIVILAIQLHQKNSESKTDNTESVQDGSITESESINEPIMESGEQAGISEAVAGGSISQPAAKATEKPAAPSVTADKAKTASKATTTVETKPQTKTETEETKGQASAKTVKAAEPQTPASGEGSATVSGVKHLSFKGVPIDGTLSQFVTKMRAAGFTTYKPRYSSDESTDSRSATLTGDFAGFKGCIVKVSSLSNLDLVCKIFVQFSGHDNWTGVYADYSQLKDLLTEKYGNPTKCVERFEDTYNKDNGSRWYGVVFDKCTYKTTFSPAEGTLVLSISHESVSSAFVTLEYYDAVNMKAEKSTAISDL